MVLQLANNENLSEYLKINFSKLEWTDKLRMANFVSTPQNILVHDEKLLIAEFGLSKDETSKTSKLVFGVFFGKFQMADRHSNCLKKIPYGIIFHASKGEREIPIEGTVHQIHKFNFTKDVGIMVPELEEISRKLMDLLENENLVQVNSTNLFHILYLKSQFRIFNYQPIQIMTMRSFIYGFLLCGNYNMV
ncbi:hypothetical protein C2G38_2247099 [Gigaspora rosea]|uniref:Uncharacterized protein n=1 Tax=Gigaspora rosea TaxID=44941 RepID=A0A397V1G8_9GLOM|nr:hypothetical protein C2G38_2247099 [Gigaspora rosea]